MNEKLTFRADSDEVFADRDWWREAGSVVGLDLRGWTFRSEGQFVDATTGASVYLPGSVAERLIALRRASSGEVLEGAGKPRGFAGWRDQLNRLEAIIHEFGGDVAPNGPADRAWAIINEMLEGFEDVLEQEIASPPPSVEPQAAEGVEVVAYAGETGLAQIKDGSSPFCTVQPTKGQDYYTIPLVRLSDYQALAAEAHRIARALTKALVGLTPGGSEYFSRSVILDDYFADVDACTGVIRERFESGHQAKLERVDERRRAETAEATIAKLRKQVKEAREVAANTLGLLTEEGWDKGPTGQRIRTFLNPLKDDTDNGQQ